MNISIKVTYLLLFFIFSFFNVYSMKNLKHYSNYENDYIVTRDKQYCFRVENNQLIKYDLKYNQRISSHQITRHTKFKPEFRFMTIEPINNYVVLALMVNKTSRLMFFSTEYLSLEKELSYCGDKICEVAFTIEKEIMAVRFKSGKISFFEINQKFFRKKSHRALHTVLYVDKYINKNSESIYDNSPSEYYKLITFNEEGKFAYVCNNNLSEIAILQLPNFKEIKRINIHTSYPKNVFITSLSFLFIDGHELVLDLWGGRDSYLSPVISTLDETYQEHYKPETSDDCSLL